GVLCLVLVVMGRNTQIVYVMEFLPPQGGRAQVPPISLGVLRCLKGHDLGSPEKLAVPHQAGEA
ncbi:MAG: hypothetical protein ABF727_12135, partial [Gluconobacter oxydans]